jgi:hypothetical protein
MHAVMIAQVTPVAFKAVGWRFYLVFAVCSLSNALFFWAFLPETRGIPLEEVDAYFAKVPLFVPRSTVAVGDMEAREREMREEGARVVGRREDSVAEKEKKEGRGGESPVEDEKAEVEHIGA